MKSIESSIIDWDVEKKGLYEEADKETEENTEELITADSFVGCLDKEIEENTKDSESADSFVGSLDEETEELFSARSIGKATVPKALTTDKKEARKVEEDIIKSDKQINDEFKEQAESMISKLEGLFR